MHLKKIICGALRPARAIIAGTLLLPGILPVRLSAQPSQSPATEQTGPAERPYRETTARINDLIHTKLDLRFDYKQRYCYGKEWVTLKPHFYPTDSLRLDAKGMELRVVALVKEGKRIPLRYSYDGLSLAIMLDRVYRGGERYTLYLDYVSKPNELKVPKNAKGLYFVNPDGAEKDKPTQIWTEGEPESSSAWFPTIDKPNQKTTEEMVLTVPAKYVTLSNGRLAAQRLNADGTRTDTWKMELPHAPYLFMLAVGDFRKYTEHWHGKEVSYYLDPRFAPFAKDIYGLTPEAIDFFSKTLGVDFPWNKYAQIAVADYISGAMENTTATVMGEPWQKSKRQFIDPSYNPGIEHELFHQWFGDYVTAESWSNITLNESFADLGEIIWLDHKYGRDVADEHVYQGLQGYLENNENKTRPLVNFYYGNIKEAFGVAYQKGGRILYMLRNYLGEAAFYKGLHLYLTANAFQSAEVPQLRLALEEASGLDLNWFFNQWYYRPGHPELNITYKWDRTGATGTVYLQQIQDGDPFILPIAIDVYRVGVKERHSVWMRHKTDSFLFHASTQPDLVNVDADKILVAQKTDHKTMAEYCFEYFHAPLYADRREAIDAAAGRQEDSIAQRILLAALRDRFSGLRLTAIAVLNSQKEDIRNINEALRKAAIPILISLSRTDSNTLVQAAAINSLATLKDSGNAPLFIASLKSRSYEVQGAALNALGLLDPALALPYAKSFEKDNKGALTMAILRVYGAKGGAAEWDFVYRMFTEASLQDKIHLVARVSDMIGRLENPSDVLQGIELLRSLAIKYKSVGAGPYISKYLAQIREQRTRLNDTTAAAAIDEAIRQISEAP